MSFIDELKRRKVFRVAASYAVVAFIIMQLVEILFPMFNFPQWTQQFTVIIVLLGFPIAVILSWVFDKTPQGYVKTDAPKTKDVAGVLKALGIDSGTTLITTDQLDRNVYKSARNISGVTVSPVADLNALSVLSPDRLLVTKAALDAIVENASAS